MRSIGRSFSDRRRGECESSRALPLGYAFRRCSSTKWDRSVWPPSSPGSKSASAAYCCCPSPASKGTSRVRVTCGDCSRSFALLAATNNYAHATKRTSNYLKRVNVSNLPCGVLAVEYPSIKEAKKTWVKPKKNLLHASQIHAFYLNTLVNNLVKSFPNIKRGKWQSNFISMFIVLDFSSIFTG